MIEGSRGITLGSFRFVAFLVAQFLGAANDNAFKVTLLLLVLATVPDESSQVLYASAAAALFPIPFLLFSPLAGSLADRFRKDRMLLFTKLPEVAAMALAAVGFASGSLTLLFGALFLMATQSAFFSPAKYGILPEIFPNERLSMANGVLELTTNLAILSGSVGGIVVYGYFKDDLVGAGWTYLAIALVGTLAIALSPQAPAGHRGARFVWDLLASARGDWMEARRISVLFYAILGIAWFGFLGSLFLTLVPIFGTNVLGLAEERAGALLAVLSVGVAVGSVGAGRLSRGQVEIGLVPLGSLGITVFAFDFAWNATGADVLPLIGIPRRAAIDLLLLGVSSGFFSVPLNALLQQRSPAGMKGRLIAFANVLSFGAVLMAALVPGVLTGFFAVPTADVLLVGALLTIAGTVVVVRLVPDFLVRLLLWFLTNTVYRVRVVGKENVPREGALFVANHVSWVDFLLIGAASDRMIRFLMFRSYYEWPVLNGFFRRMGAIPVAAGDPPRKTAESLAIARAELRAGHVVCIFAEGAITRTGNLLKFRHGFERIAAEAKCPVIPVYLDGVWGSLFSFERGRFFFNRPRRLREPVTVVFGKPLPPTTQAHEVRREIQELSVEAFRLRKDRQRPLDRELFRRARRRWWQRLAIDESGGLRRGTALVTSIALARRLPHGASRVGVLFPPGIPATLANFAATIAGQTPVNLDPRNGGRWIPPMRAATRIDRVITSRAFVESRGLLPALGGAQLVDLDDILASIPMAERLWLSMAVWMLPSAWSGALLSNVDVHDVDREAAILFSWDDVERPRGVVLSHHNLLSNLESLRQVFRVTGDDVVLGALPLSHPVGLLATLWLPAISGARVAFFDAAGSREHPATAFPLEGVTLIPGTPALLEALMQREPGDLRGLRYVAVGGEPLDDAIRARFVERFEVEPLESWGGPECGAIVSLNLPGVGRQPGGRKGSAGQVLPGFSVRAVDAAGELVSPGEEGRLEVRGPSLMRGYLDTGSRDPGWLATPWRGSIDFEGFVSALSRSPASH